MATATYRAIHKNRSDHRAPEYRGRDPHTPLYISHIEVLQYIIYETSTNRAVLQSIIHVTYRSVAIHCMSHPHVPLSHIERSVEVHCICNVYTYSVLKKGVWPKGLRLSGLRPTNSIVYVTYRSVAVHCICHIHIYSVQPKGAWPKGLRCVAVCCSALQCVAVCCCVLQ